MTPFIFALLIKVTLILALGLIAVAMVRNFGPALRHQVLLVTLGGSLVLPLAMMFAPQWDLRVLPPVVATGNGAVTVSADPSALDIGPSTSTSMADSRLTDAVAPSFTLWSQRAALPLVWAVGFLGVLVWLIAGRIRLRRIAAGSWPLTGSDWDRALDEEKREAGVSRHLRLLSSSVVSTPLTWGSRAPVILLPEDALDWPEAHRRIVLRHELAHVARGDALSQLGTGFVCALYWFHPLVWIAERRLRAECERACDDRVVSLGTPAAEYAAHLLEVARSARSFGAPGFLSVAMARPSQLEGRLLAVLNESGRRAFPARGARVTALLLTLFILMTVSAFRAVPRIVPLAAPTIAAPTVTEAIVTSTPAPRANQIVNTYALPVASIASPPSLDSTFQRSAPAKNGGTLTIDLETGGSVNITGWDQQQVLVKASLGGRSWRDTDVKFQAVDGGVRLETDYTGRSNSQSNSHFFDIQVPRSFNVRIRSSGGSVAIAGVDGVFTGHTGGGEIEIRNARGEANIRTGGGDIRVADSRLTGSVSTGGGTIRIERVSGNLVGNSGSGPVTYISSGGGIKGKTGSQGVGTGKGSGFGASGIRMKSGGGAISVPEAPDGAHVSTGGGAIRIGPSAGEVYASTGGGTVDIGPARGSVEAHTGAGEVMITITGAGSHSVNATSGKGRIVLVLPRDLSANLELETAYTDNFGYKTSIESDWPLTTTETKDWDNSEGTPRKYVRARQAIGGGGGVIRVRTVNGNIVLRRSN